RTNAEANELRGTIFDWTIKYRQLLSDSSVKYIRKKLEETSADPFGYFYLLYKLHKTPIKTRPVCSDCASLPHALGEWVDEMLQPMVKAQHTYFKDSYTLKQELARLTLPANATIFSFDAVSIPSKIPALPSRSVDQCHYNHNEKQPHMRFGDIILRQLIGIAMGMSPAPSLANLYVAIHEERELL
ncbi:hypothetical protein ACHAXR_000837, partial [Thalassiosira sp. AJA248-18]